MKIGKLFFLLNIFVVCHLILSCLCRKGQATRGNLLALKAIEQDLQQKKKRKRNLILYSLGSAALIAALVVTGIGLNMYMKRKKDESHVQEVIEAKEEEVKEKQSEKKKTTVKVVPKRVPVKTRSAHGRSKVPSVNHQDVAPKLDDEKKEEPSNFTDNDLVLTADSLKVLEPKLDENSEGADFLKNMNEPKEVDSFSLDSALTDASEQNENKDAELSTDLIHTPTDSSLDLSDDKKDTSTNDLESLNLDSSSPSEFTQDKPQAESETMPAEPSAQEPMIPEPSAQEPTTPESSSQEPTTPESSSQEPLTPESSSQEPTTPESSSQEPTTPESSSQEPTTPEPTSESKTPEIKEVDEPVVVPSYYPTTGPNPNTHGPPRRRTSSRSSGSSNRTSSGTTTRPRSRSNTTRDSSGRSSGRTSTPKVRKEQ
ncbi:early transcribed membrane protein 10.2 [Plasmodium sp. gorilla clade G2]|uniref:early transcribed membrane protein 10.2 n=1 Tax=Plasmodium sp. gorilla clade G2 TaxID=880535 RepID=UPI000D2167EB|nr:early transcribed membrane protein 10.2 [Plasmodium sp. gorilla clade G2]SOV15194.1 early transcribed membrane protein 10.2 [Plasmodium sp. gorilla clade G2]